MPKDRMPKGKGEDMPKPEHDGTEGMERMPKEMAKQMKAMMGKERMGKGERGMS